MDFSLLRLIQEHRNNMANFQDTALVKSILTPRFRYEEFSEYMDFWHDYEISADPVDKLSERAYLSLSEKETIEKDVLYWENEKILKMEHNLLPVLARMELAGVNLDAVKLRLLGEKMATEIKQLEIIIHDTVGEKFNINSSKQLQEILFGKLQIPVVKKNKTGLSVDNEVLELISEKYAIAKDILEYRSLQKLHSTYVEWLLKMVHPVTGRIHTTYRQLGTTTGRMSSENPNLQNIPTGAWYAGEIKSCFIPKDLNYSLLVADYSQVELRILASLTGDQNLIDAFLNGEDIHMRTARFLFGDNVTISGDMRRQAKAVNFGVIYGITGFWLSKMIGASPADGNRYIETFFAKYPTVRAYYDNLLEQARKTGYVETYFWRRRYIEWLNDANKMTRAGAEREAINMPIQWTAADIIKFAMIRLDETIREKKMKSRLLMQVHDELVVETHIDELEIMKTLVKNTMEQVVDFAVPILVDIGVWPDWNSAKH